MAAPPLTTIGNANAPGTPGKRASAPGANVSLPSAKRQRSFPTDVMHTLSQPTSGDGDGGPGQEEGEGLAAQNSPLVNILRMEHARRASSPGVLKSSLKSTKPFASSDAHLAAIGSPSEGDKRSMYSEYVSGALLDKQKGKDGAYNELVSQFHVASGDVLRAPPPLGLLQMLLHALTGVASKLDKKRHSGLVHAILILPWATIGGDPFARTWTRFVCALCSARSEWVVDVVTRCMKGLSYRSDWRAIVYIPGGPSNSQPTRRIIYARIHTLLRSLLSLIPTLPSQLGPLIVRHFPHKGEGLREHVVYVQNIFAICGYAEDLRLTVLECVIGRSLEIDVEIQIELDELEEAEADFDEAGDELDDRQSSTAALGAELLDKPLDDDSDSDDEGDDEGDVGLDHLDSDEEEDEDDAARERAQTEAQRLVQVRRLADKLDAIMSLLFEHMEASETRLSQASKGLIGLGESMTPDRAIRLRNDHFGDLMRIFERSMLPTFKSRHVQFVMFWVASLERTYCDVFVGMLLGKAIYSSGGEEDDSFDEGEGNDSDWNMTQGTPTVLRIAASSYVASLVSRARFIDAQDARIVMLNLCAFLEAHLNAHPQVASGSQPSTPMAESDILNGPHAMFYAVAQACFYIFCFRWRDLRSSDDDEAGDDGDDGDNDGGIDEDAMRNGGMVEWCDGMESIKRAVLSNLNPLAFCSTAVVRQFAGVAQLTGFIYCWNIIERNSRNGRRSNAEGTTTPTLVRSRNNSVSSLNSPVVTKDQRNSAPSSAAHSPMRIASPAPITPPASAGLARPEMDSFFPFDPYRLRGSTKWIEPIYREWSDVAPDGMASDDEDEDESGEEEGDEQDASDDDDALDSRPSSGREQRLAMPMQMKRSPHAARNGLAIPTAAAMRHRPTNPSKLSKAHGVNSPGFGASVSTDESSSIAQSLEAMSISPRYV